MLIDHYLSTPHFSERHDIIVKASARKVYEAAWQVDFADSFAVRWLLRLRGMPTSNFSLAAVERSIFKKLEEDPGREVVLGLIGRFWTLFGDLRPIRTPEAFQSFEEAGYAKAVWNFSVTDEGEFSRLTTETRVRCLDDESRRSFGFYWTIIKPFSGAIRTEILKAVKQRAELSPARAS